MIKDFFNGILVFIGFIEYLFCWIEYVFIVFSKILKNLGKGYLLNYNKEWLYKVINERLFFS